MQPGGSFSDHSASILVTYGAVALPCRQSCTACRTNAHQDVVAGKMAASCRQEPNQETLACMLAFSVLSSADSLCSLASMHRYEVGLLAGITGSVSCMEHARLQLFAEAPKNRPLVKGWANVFLCQALSLPGVHLVGRHFVLGLGWGWWCFADS